MPETSALEQAAKQEAVPESTVIPVEVPNESVVKAEIEITTEEKLAIRDAENKFLKAQVDITRLSNEINHLNNVGQQAQQQYAGLINSFTKKYVTSPSEYTFDVAKLIFKRKQK